MLLILAPVIFIAVGGDIGSGFLSLPSAGMLLSGSVQPLGALIGVVVIVLIGRARSRGRCARSMDIAGVIAWISVFVLAAEIFLLVAAMAFVTIIRT